MEKSMQQVQSEQDKMVPIDTSGESVEIEIKQDKAIETTPRQWKFTDWPDVSAMKVFNEEKGIDPYLRARNKK